MADLWCIVLNGEVWSRHRTIETANRAADRLDRNRLHLDVTGGRPPVLCRDPQVGDVLYEDCDVIDIGSRQEAYDAR